MRAVLLITLDLDAHGLTREAVGYEDDPHSLWRAVCPCALLMGRRRNGDARNTIAKVGEGSDLYGELMLRREGVGESLLTGTSHVRAVR